MWKVNNSKMHGLSEIGPNVPAFLIKLWKLVNSPETDDLICWSESGLSFLINNPAQFSRKLLSLYYKHNNMASFIRQLNMYDFHKVVSDGGGLKSDNLKNRCKDYMEFAHQYFIKDHPYLLENIKRKLPNPKSGVISNEQLNNSNLKNGTQSEILAKVLSDVNSLKGKQESWDARLASMKRENEALWRELATFRQKHLKQEQIINRLIHFIVTIVQPSRNVLLRRRYPLMLNDIQPVKKITKLSGVDPTQLNQGSPTGPTIHEIDTADVLLGNSEQSEVPAEDTEFLSSEFSSTPKFEEVSSSEIDEKESKAKASIEVSEKIPEDWLEIQLTEGQMIDPLTPVDPAKVNPTVAAAIRSAAKATKRKSSSGSSSAKVAKVVPALQKGAAKAKACEPEVEIDDLEFLLSSKKSDAGVARARESEDKTSSEKTPTDSFLKLQSLYNGTISEDNLVVSPSENTMDLNKIGEETEETAPKVDDKLSPASFAEPEKLDSEEKTENAETVLNFEPDSLAIVCQNPGGSDALSRELSSHVDSVQGELDLLKEILKGEGYNFETNTLPWLFTDDALSYGVLPATDEDENEKKNEEAGNELMTYGAPNLMDLVDMIGSTPSSQDWSNVLSPTTDLSTPSPSPSSFAFPSSNKRRKI